RGRRHPPIARGTELSTPIPIARRTEPVCGRAWSGPVTVQRPCLRTATACLRSVLVGSRNVPGSLRLGAGTSVAVLRERRFVCRDTAPTGDAISPTQGGKLW